jgi:hypothetical protein
MRLIEKRLKNMLGRDLIQKRLLLSARYACQMQRSAGRSGGVAFVHEQRLKVKTARQAPRKTPA